jgi:hypothetical protein
MEKLFMGWGLRVSEFWFFFLFFCFFLPSVTLARKYSVWSAEGLPSTFGVGGWRACRQAVVASGSVGGQVVVWQEKAKSFNGLKHTTHTHTHTHTQVLSLLKSY